MELTDTPAPVAKGLRAWRNPNNGFVSVLLHFSADPEGPDEDARRAGMESQAYMREHALDFTSFAGTPAYLDFNEKRHVFDFQPDDTWQWWRGWDFGYRRPACVWVACHGGLWAYGEVVGEDMTLQRFVEDVAMPYEDTIFAGHNKPRFLDAADPAGRQVSDKSEYTSFAILSNYGIFPVQKKTEIAEGLTIIRQKMATDGGFALHPRCRVLIEGAKGGYRYPDPTTGTPNPLFPLKDGFYEHPMDALRYVAVNAFTVRVDKPKSPEPKEAPGVKEFLAKRGRGQQDPDWGAFGV